MAVNSDDRKHSSVLSNEGEQRETLPGLQKREEREAGDACPPEGLWTHGAEHGLDGMPEHLVKLEF